MNKPLMFAAAIAATVAVAYVATARHVGSVIGAEVGRFENSLARLDEVRVHRLGYERRLFDGTLHYDLALKPIPGSPLHAQLRAMPGVDANLDFRIEGSIAVRHGPWVGGDARFALARMEGGLALPAQLREHLPQYPGQRPMLEADGILGFDRKLDLRLWGIDYRGRIVDTATDTSGDLVFAGFTGQFGFDSSADWLHGALRLDEFALDISGADQGEAAIRGIAVDADLKHSDTGLWTGPAAIAIRDIAMTADGAELRLADLELRSDSRIASGRDGSPKLAVEAHAGIASGRFEVTESGKRMHVLADGLAIDVDAIREWPAIWLGRATATLARLEGGDGDTTLHMAALQLRSDAEFAGELINQRIRYQSGPIAINGSELAGGTLQIGLDGIRGEVLDTLVRELERHQDDLEALAVPGFQAVLQSAIERTLSETVSLRLDPVSLHVQDADDISARFEASFAGAPGLALDDLPQLLERLEIQAAFSARTSALKALARIATEAEGWSPGTVVAHTDPAALSAEAETRFQMMMLAARQAPYLIVTPEEIRAQASFKDGRLLLNGTDLGTDMLAGLAGLTALFGDDDDPQRPLDVPNFDAAAMFETINLSADFEPDPYRLELMAGGSTELHAGLGADCTGHVNADQPDVALNYAAGSFPLYIYAESDEDVSLAVRAPDGNWHCNDDGPDRGLDPTIEFGTPDSGTYHVWVGTISSAPAQATLMFSGIGPSTR